MRISITRILPLAAMWLAAVPPLLADDEGFTSLFNGKNLDGWVVMGKAEGWQVRNGVIHSDGAKGGANVGYGLGDPPPGMGGFFDDMRAQPALGCCLVESSCSCPSESRVVFPGERRRSSDSLL
jgi:hypothetical protein